MAEDTVREECDERTGEYRENEAGKDRDPLQSTTKRRYYCLSVVSLYSLHARVLPSTEIMAIL